jgi:hypothetical protein
MISDELMKRRNAGAIIDRAVDAMVSVDVMRKRAMETVGDEFPLVFWTGTGRIVGADEKTLSLLVRGLRADFTWERLGVTWQRLLDNHTLDVDELGGGHDAVGIVSIFAHLAAGALDVIDEDGLLVVKKRPDRPIHQYSDMSRPTAWAQWRRDIHGD